MIRNPISFAVLCRDTRPRLESLLELSPSAWMIESYTYDTVKFCFQKRMANACGQMMRNSQNRCFLLRAWREDEQQGHVSHQFIDTMFHVYASSPELSVDTFLHFKENVPRDYRLPREICSFLLLKDPRRMLPNIPIDDLKISLQTFQPYDEYRLGEMIWPCSVHCGSNKKNISILLFLRESGFTWSTRIEKCVLTHGTPLLLRQMRHIHTWSISQAIAAGYWALAAYLFYWGANSSNEDKRTLVDFAIETMTWTIHGKDEYVEKVHNPIQSLRRAVRGIVEENDQKIGGEQIFTLPIILQCWQSQVGLFEDFVDNEYRYEQFLTMYSSKLHCSRSQVAEIANNHLGILVPDSP